MKIKLFFLLFQSIIENDQNNIPSNFESINEEDEDEELLKLESEIAMLNTQTEFEIGQVNGTLSEKEELLRKITENHMELEKVYLNNYK